MRRLLIVPLMLLAAAGCGGGGANRDEAVQVAADWLRAVGERDADRACELMHDSAVRALRVRGRMNPETKCPTVVRAYGDGFGRGDIERILKIGLEPEGRVKDDELGVFPKTGPRELQVILMRRSGGEWKVASTSLGPTPPES